jgi:HK97 family phage prohead protease
LSGGPSRLTSKCARAPIPGFTLRGYAAVFDSVSHDEVVRSSAFNKTLAERDDVRLLVNHDGVPLARTKSGTLT